MAYVDKNSFHSIDTTSTQTIEKTKLPGTDGKHSIDQGTQTISPKYLEKTNISFSLKFVLKVRTVLYQIKTTFSSLAKINASVNKDSLSIEQAKVLFLSSKTTPEQKLTLVSKFGTELIDAENASTMDNTLDTLLKSDSLSPIDKNKVLNFMLDVGKPISNSILNDLVEKGINKDGGTSLKEIYNNPNLVDKLTDKTRTRLLEHLFSSKYISSEDKCNILNAQLHYKKSNSFTNWNPSNTMQEISKMISSNEDNASQLFDNLISKNDNIYKNLDPFSKLNLCDKIFQSNNVSIENKISLGKTFLNENNDFASKIKLCEKIFQSEIFSTENKGEALGKLLNEIPILKDDTRNKFLPKLNSMIDSLVESGKDNGKALSHCLINNKGVWYLNLSSYTNTCKKICQSREVSLSDKGEALKKLASNRFVNNFSSIARTVYETTDGITADQLNEIVHNLPLSEEQKEKVELLISEIENNEIYNQENEISKKMVKELSNNPENKTEIIHKSIEDCKSFMAKSCGINVKTLEDKNKTLLEKFSQEITEYVDKNISDLSSKDEAERNFHIADMPFQLKQIIDKVLKDIKTDDFEIGYYNFLEDDYIDSNELFNYDDLNEIHVYQNDQEFDVGASISDENLFDPSTTENKPKELTLKDAQSNLQNLKNMLNSANLSTSINSLSKDIESLQVIGTNEDQLKDFQNMLQTLKNIR